MQQIAHAADLVTEWEHPGAAEKQPLARIAAQGCGQLVVNAELTPLVIAIAQAALGQAIETLGAAGLGMRHRLQP